MREPFSTNLLVKTVDKVEKFKIDNGRKIKATNIIIEFLIENYLDKISFNEILEYQEGMKKRTKKTDRNIYSDQ